MSEKADNKIYFVLSKTGWGWNTTSSRVPIATTNKEAAIKAACAVEKAYDDLPEAERNSLGNIQTSIHAYEQKGLLDLDFPESKEFKELLIYKLYYDNSLPSGPEDASFDYIREQVQKDFRAAWMSFSVGETDSLSEKYAQPMYHALSYLHYPPTEDQNETLYSYRMAKMFSSDVPTFNDENGNPIEKGNSILKTHKRQTKRKGKNGGENSK